jgi:hypothetical protein
VATLISNPSTHKRELFMYNENDANGF